MIRFLLLLSLALSLVFANTKCTPHTRLKRQAWHTLSRSNKNAYISAELCLMRLPRNPALALPGTTSRFEDLQAAHQLQSYRVHNVGAFLPFHRALLSAHETALRKECGYKGAQPYWAEEPDAGDFLGSTTYRDFGGDGDEGGCVNKGPFANVTNHLGPGYGYTNHCINRARDESFSTLSSQVYVDECLAKKTWLAHWNCTENNPHLGGHGGVGGLMVDPVSSPGDPLFYLHHTWLDKIWADWQKKDLPKRLREMGGNNVQDEAHLPPGFPPRPAGVPLPTGADGDPGLETTLNHVLNLYGNGPNRTIGEVMDIWNGVLCYEYY